MSGRRWALLVLLLVVARVLGVAAGLHDARAKIDGSMLRIDADRYHTIAESHGRPYQDFPVEFPPVTLGVIELVNGSTVDHTMARVAWSQVVADLLVAGALAFGWGRRASVAYLVLGLPFLIYPFAYLRLDFVSVALALWGLALVRRRWEATGGVLLALGVLAKLWPLVVAPVLVVGRRARSLIGFAASLGVGLVAWVAWSGTEGPRQVATLRGARGWQIESMVGSVYRVVADSPIFFDQGANRTGSAPGWARVVLDVALVAAVGAVWWLVWRHREESPGVIDGVAPVTAIAAFLVFSPLFSPQYLLWLLPFAAIAFVHDERGAAALVVPACVLSILLFSNGTLRVLEVKSQLMLLGRNALVVALLVTGLTRLGRGAPVSPAARAAEVGGG
jgi:hypothetical protein